MDIAFDYTRACFLERPACVLKEADDSAQDGSLPMVFYALATIHLQLGDQTAARDWHRRAQAANPRYCFPNRLEEMQVLESATAFDPSDARAHYYLGNFLYDRRRHREAITHWELSTQLDRTLPTAWRNLGIGHFNVERAANRLTPPLKRLFGRTLPTRAFSTNGINSGRGLARLLN